MFSESSHLPPPVHYWQDKRGNGSPLCVIRDHVRGTTLPLPPRDVADLGARTGLPESAVRRAVDYYRAIAVRERGARLMICQGTACRLAGAQGLRERLEKKKLACHGVTCLGYCDTSPALLDERDSAYTGEEAAHFDERRGFPQSVLGFPLPKLVSCCETPLILPRLFQGGARTLAEALGQGAYEGLRQALTHPPGALLALVTECGLSGAEGRVAERWKTCATTDAEDRYVIGHAHAGVAGAVVDRLLLEYDPHALLEGLALAGRAIGASHGILFVPSEYPQALRQVEAALREANAAGLLGRNVLGSGWSFYVSLFPSAGRCAGSEATILIDAIERLRGEARPRPPAPEVAGLHRLPTLVEPLEVLAQLGRLAASLDASPWLSQGTPACPGTRVLCLNSGFARPGIVEAAHGHSLRELIETQGGGSKNGEPVEAVLVGGLGGSLLPPAEWDLPLCPGAFAERGLRLGNGSLVPLTVSTDYRDLLSHWLEYMDGESCGKCTPCRLGPAGVVNLAARYEKLTVEGRLRDATRARRDLETLFSAMELGSLCSFGQNVPQPMRRLVDLFWDRIFPRDS